MNNDPATLRNSIANAKAKLHLMQPDAASQLRRMIWYYEDKLRLLEEAPTAPTNTQEQTQ
jgi:hypothetical protein